MTESEPMQTQPRESGEPAQPESGGGQQEILDVSVENPNAVSEAQIVGTGAAQDMQTCAQQQAGDRQEMQALPAVEAQQKEADAFAKYIAALPEIQKAKALQQQAREMQVQLQMEKEMQEISRMNAQIKGREDLAAMPTYGEMLRLVNRGNTLVDAYRLANFEALTASAAAATRQQVLNQLGETAHLTQTAVRQGRSMEAVPAEIMRQYRVFNPTATDAEIQRHYNQECRKSMD